MRFVGRLGGHSIDWTLNSGYPTPLMGTQSRFILGSCLIAGLFLVAIGNFPAIQARIALSDALEQGDFHEVVEGGELGKVALPGLLDRLRAPLELPVQTAVIGAVHEAIEVWAEGFRPGYFRRRLADPAPAVRLVAAEILAGNTDADKAAAIATLQDLLELDGFRGVRLRAATTLLALAPSIGSAGRVATKVLIDHLQDGDALGGSQTVRDAAVAALRKPAGLSGSSPVASKGEVVAILRWWENLQ